MKRALRDVEAFPDDVRRDVVRAPRLAAQGEKADTAKPMKGFGAGVFEIALRRRGDTFRAVYAVQLDGDVWVLHAFQKKSTPGIKTPKPDSDLIHARIKRLKEQLR